MEFQTTIQFRLPYKQQPLQTKTSPLSGVELQDHSWSGLSEDIETLGVSSRPLNVFFLRRQDVVCVTVCKEEDIECLLNPYKQQQVLKS